MPISQKNRVLYLTTPLGPDALAMSGFSGTEGMSELFRFELSMLSESESIDAKDIVGKRVTWSIRHKEGPPRFFNGFVSRFSSGGASQRKQRSYRAEIVPWLWFLTCTSNCRIWPPGGQKKTSPEIIKMIFDELGFTDYKFDLKKTYAKRAYCVQYRETAFNFISRLMEEEGIFYFFRHEDGKHVMMIGDQKTSYYDMPKSDLQIENWEHQFEFGPGKWTRTDYYFKTPSTNLATSTNTILSLPDMNKYEMFDYPGNYRTKADGEAITKARMEEHELAHEVVKSSSRCRDLSPGGKFTMSKTDGPGESEAGKSYVVTHVDHSARDVEFETDSGLVEYINQFQCVPQSVVFRPARVTPKPVISGAQTAVVVGPAGEEIYTDKYGRVKVQFFWDRKGKKDENSSCWIRVAENWAGKNWGVVFNPRIGQEVVVEFLEGDPDRPIITGRVYNGDQMPPYELPNNQTQSVIKTRSSKGGGTENFNELRFEDKKDKEEIYFHAEKDFNRVVENNDTLKVGSPKAEEGSQTTEIYKDKTETVKTGNRDVKIEMGNEALTIKMGNQTTKLDLGKSETEAMQSIELKVGQSSVKLDQMGVTIKGMMIKVEGQIMTDVKGLMTKVGADAILQVKGGLTMIG